MDVIRMNKVCWGCCWIDDGVNICGLFFGGDFCFGCYMI